MLAGPQDEEIRQRVDHVDGVEHPVGPAIMGTVLVETIGSDMVRTLRSQLDAGAAIEPEPGPFPFRHGNFQRFAPPDPRHPLVVHVSARAL